MGELADTSGGQVWSARVDQVLCSLETSQSNGGQLRRPEYTIQINIGTGGVKVVDGIASGLGSGQMLERCSGGT